MTTTRIFGEHDARTIAQLERCASVGSSETEGSDGGEMETEEIASEALDRIASLVSSEHDTSSRAVEAHSAIATAREVKPARFIPVSMSSVPRRANRWSLRRSVPP